MSKPKELSLQEHINRHKKLHENLDELVADFITHTKGRPSTSTIMDLIEWSFIQTEKPDE